MTLDDIARDESGDIFSDEWAREEMEHDYQRCQILARYFDKPVRHVFQMDAFVDNPPDCIAAPDADGDDLYAGWQHELRRLDIPVRVQIMDGISQEVALRLLLKIALWLERDPDLLAQESDNGPGQVIAQPNCPF